MWEIWAKQFLQNAFKSWPKSYKSTNLVTLFSVNFVALTHLRVDGGLVGGEVTEDFIRRRVCPDPIFVINYFSIPESDLFLFWPVLRFLVLVIVVPLVFVLVVVVVLLALVVVIADAVVVVILQVVTNLTWDILRWKISNKIAVLKEFDNKEIAASFLTRKKQILGSNFRGRNFQGILCAEYCSKNIGKIMLQNRQHTFVKMMLFLKKWAIPGPYFVFLCPFQIILQNKNLFTTVGFKLESSE